MRERTVRERERTVQAGGVGGGGVGVVGGGGGRWVLTKLTGGTRVMSSDIASLKAALTSSVRRRSSSTGSRFFKVPAEKRWLCLCGSFSGGSVTSSGATALSRVTSVKYTRRRRLRARSSPPPRPWRTSTRQPWLGSRD